jgi:hypothetical protein
MVTRAAREGHGPGPTAHGACCTHGPRPEAVAWVIELPENRRKGEGCDQCEQHEVAMTDRDGDVLL